VSDSRIELVAAAADTDAEVVLSEFDRIRPIIRLRRSASQQEARAAATLFACATRTFAHAELDGDGELGTNPWGGRRLAELPDLFASLRPPAAREAKEDVVVAIDPSTARADLWLGGGGMTAVVGRSPVSIDEEPVGLGLQLATCIAAGELVKAPFERLGIPVTHIDHEFTMNLIDFSARRAPLLDRPPAVKPDLALFGTGSVGTSAASVLAMEPMVRGDVRAVDPDSFDPRRNPFRYPALVTNVEGSKAEWTLSLLREAGWVTPDEAFVGTVGEWVVGRPRPGFDGLALSSVDRRDGRLEVADALASTTLSLGVGGLSFHLQREHLGDGLACPFCDFVSLAPATTQADLYVAHTGLALDRVLALTVRQEGLALEDIDVAIATGHLLADRSSELVGRPLADLMRAGYAQASVGTPGAEVRVSAPHVSWFAGVLGAAEVVKAAYGLPLIDRRIDIDTLGLPPSFVRTVPADPSGRCVCHSPWRRRYMGLASA
jgi:hypothetical protein